ncbi:vesicle coat component [Rhizophlyctis rosea]|uniref:Vesicle coat component n=1 Tax=Rhizophlyctis rosea TaxID=64517 RepID=A0AAD5S9S8_9FUNG|nr:vesicle coat component [Rhizophlyctis rosea]
MAHQRTLPILLAVLLFFAILPAALAVKWQIPATTAVDAYHDRKCLTQYHQKDTLLVGHVEAGPGEGQRIEVSFTDTTPAANQYYHKSHLTTRQKFAFTTHADAIVYFCFQNILDNHITPSPHLNRSIILHVDSQSSEGDIHADQRKEKLKPMEEELRQMEHFARDVLAELEYLKKREEEMRDTNGG